MHPKWYRIDLQDAGLPVKSFHYMVAVSKLSDMCGKGHARAGIQFVLLSVVLKFNPYIFGVIVFLRVCNYFHSGFLVNDMKNNSSKRWNAYMVRISIFLILNNSNSNVIALMYIYIHVYNKFNQYLSFILSLQKFMRALKRVSCCFYNPRN